MDPVVFYCYDAYCGWCYGFSPVIRRIAEEYEGKFTETDPYVDRLVAVGDDSKNHKIFLIHDI